jgi:hypothetical protein
LKVCGVYVSSFGEILSSRKTYVQGVLSEKFLRIQYLVLKLEGAH